MLSIANLYLDFSIKNAGFLVEICNFFSRAISTALIIVVELSFDRETGKCSQKIAKIVRNKESIFVPKVAIFNPGKKFDPGRF